MLFLVQLREKGLYYSFDLNLKINYNFSKQIKEIDINRLTNFYGKESRSNEPTGSNTEDGKLKLTSILDLTPKSSTKILPDIKSEVKGADSIEPIEVRKQIKIENEKDGKPSETILDNGLFYYMIIFLK